MDMSLMESNLVIFLIIVYGLRLFNLSTLIKKNRCSKSARYIHGSIFHTISLF